MIIKIKESTTKYEYTNIISTEGATCEPLGSCTISSIPI